MKLTDLVLAFCRAPEARRCAQSTKRNRQRAFDRLLQQLGADTDIKILDDRGTRVLLYDWRDTFTESPHEGNQTLMYASALFNWAVDRGYCRDNPARGMKRLGPKTSRSECIWSPAQVRALAAVAGRPILELVLTELWTGISPCDLLRLTTANFNEGWIEMRRRKTDVPTLIPYYMSDVLAELLTPLINMSWRASEPVFRSPTGLRWTERNFNLHFSEAKQRAGLGDEDLRFYDLRGTYVTGLLEAGCTEAERAALSGHALASGSGVNYAARTRALAENAYSKLIGGDYGKKYDVGPGLCVRQGSRRQAPYGAEGVLA